MKSASNARLDNMFHVTAVIIEFQLLADPVKQCPCLLRPPSHLDQLFTAIISTPFLRRVVMFQQELNKVAPGVAARSHDLR